MDEEAVRRLIEAREPRPSPGSSMLQPFVESPVTIPGEAVVHVPSVETYELMEETR